MDQQYSEITSALVAEIQSFNQQIAASATATKKKYLTKKRDKLIIEAQRFFMELAKSGRINP